MRYVEFETQSWQDQMLQSNRVDVMKITRLGTNRGEKSVGCNRVLDKGEGWKSCVLRHRAS